ncbi:hypothetical protein RSOLAG1IB_09558 [Rhizoctonia solani AG-1 IB]|uniref:N-acetyltransferase domain-containing protein n=1 Tax=Thanatephorus cucumeris (strain AG1-IB / isolate 7/3/14) TaxID=1108050 RepID=A0A0B7FRM7_THACB|nr:hypothetical protein RSOLAG1IB_09558 [Rhizoctonia solani AG-1 IB]
MPYQSCPISDAEIDALPLRFVRLEQGEEEAFTDVLLKVWFALAESGSLATLPPVPDVVSFVDDCAIFYLIFHTDPKQLKLAPGDRLASTPAPQSPPKASSSKGPGSTRASPERANKRPHPFSSQDTTPASEVIGCVYLSYSLSTQSTLDIGIALRPEARGRGYGRAAITKFLRYSFETLNIHRVVANVFGASDINQQQSARESGAVRWIFEKIGFIPEGVQRRAAFSPAEGIWRDVYPLAMLDLDWSRLNRKSVDGRAGITNPFDAMVDRHETEREEMTEWMSDESWGRLRRVSSTETIKGHDEQEQPADPATQEPPAPEPEPARSPSPIRSESDFTAPSEHEWRSATPSTDFDYSVVSHSPPPASIGSPTASETFSAFSLSNATSPGFESVDLPNVEPAPFSIIGSPDLDPPLSPGFSTTSNEAIELASLPALAQNLSPSSSAATPYIVEPAPTSPISIPNSSPTRRNAFTLQDGDEPLEFWSSDSEFEFHRR